LSAIFTNSICLVESIHSAVDGGRRVSRLWRDRIFQSNFFFEIFFQIFGILPLMIDRYRNCGRNQNRTETRIQNFEPKPKTDLNRNRNRKYRFSVDTPCTVTRLCYFLTIFCGWQTSKCWESHIFWKNYKNKFSKLK